MKTCRPRTTRDKQPPEVRSCYMADEPPFVGTSRGRKPSREPACPQVLHMTLTYMPRNAGQRAPTNKEHCAWYPMPSGMKYACCLILLGLLPDTCLPLLELLLVAYHLPACCQRPASLPPPSPAPLFLHQPWTVGMAHNGTLLHPWW